MSDVLVAVGVGALAVAVVVAVAWPFVSPERGSPEPGLSPLDRRRIALLEARDAAFAGLRDLEQDHRTGKVTDADYEQERRRLRADAGEAIRELDALDSEHTSREG